ncbi:MAG: YHYH protein [Myxococcota bacterium]
MSSVAILWGLAACGDTAASPEDAGMTDAMTLDSGIDDSGLADSGSLDMDIDDDAGGGDAGTGEGCEAITAEFQTLGSANPDLPDPEVSAGCEGAEVVVTANGIPDFPYIETSPGLPQVQDIEYRFPATPTMADAPTDVALLGPIAVAVNGVPIFGQAEGTGGDVLSLGGGFTECGGHNGPTGYHFHTFDVTGSDDCRFTEAEARAGHVLFGYAFDGYPIYSGNFQFTSSYELTDPSLFASDTWTAHTYVEGLGDLDECNGRMDEDGNYAYYTTDTFPYTLRCYRGVPTANGGGGGGPGGGGPGGGGMMP